MKKIKETTFADFDLFDFSSFILKKLALSLPSEKVVIIEEVLDGMMVRSTRW